MTKKYYAETCRHCKSKMLIKNGRYSRHYCSKKCFDESHSDRNCLICNNSFKQFIPAQIFCNDCNLRMGSYANHILWGTYYAIIGRCYNPSRNVYKYYGALGKKVSQDWLSFVNFVLDMGLDYIVGYTLDRIDNSLGYSKENCRWVTINEQRKNRGRFKGFSRKYKNISILKGGNYFVNYRHNSKSKTIGTFHTEAEAVDAYNKEMQSIYPNDYHLYVQELK